MNSENNNNKKQVMMMRYEISSDDEESDQHQVEEALHQDDISGSSGGTNNNKRSYDCTFCKRGFTNAQALGGHMNIHRKDRAKAKQVITPNSSSSLQNTNIDDGDYMVLPFSTEFKNYSILESQRNSNCELYFHNQPPPPPHAHTSYLGNQHTFSSPYPPYGHGFQHELHHHNLIRSHHQTVNFNNHQEILGDNLSLQIGPSHDHVDNNANQARRGTQKDGEVDLELRLGHDP